MPKHHNVKRRAYVVTATSVADAGRGSNALTRDAIMLEVAMRLVIEGKAVKGSWNVAQAFVREMDRRLEPLPETPAAAASAKTNADRIYETS